MSGHGLPTGVGGNVSIKVGIREDDPLYQDYLLALKRNEELREEYGGPTEEGIAGIRKAVQKLDERASAIFKQERSN